MAGFGQIDYRQLGNTAQSLSNFSDTALRNDQAKLQVEQDNADRAIAERASREFFDTLAPPMGKRGFGEAPRGQMGIGAVASGTSQAPYVPDYEKAFQAAAKAGEVLAQGGGRHSQAAALRIHQYLDDLVKIHNYRAASAPRPDVTWVSGDHPSIGGKAERQTVGKDIREKQYAMNLLNGEPLKDSKGNFIFEWKKIADVPSEGKAGVDREKMAMDKLSKEYFDNMEQVREIEKEHGGWENWTARMAMLDKDPDYQKLKGMNDFEKNMYLMKMQENNKEKAFEMKDRIRYDKALSGKSSAALRARGKGYEFDEQVGDYVPTNKEKYRVKPNQTAPKTGGKQASAKSNKDQFVKDFTSEYGRAPTDNELQKAKGKYYE